MSIVTDSEKVAHCAFKHLLTLLCDFHESWRAVTFLYLWIMFGFFSAHVYFFTLIIHAFLWRAYLESVGPLLSTNF